MHRLARGAEYMYIRFR